MSGPQWAAPAVGGLPEFLPALDIPGPGPQRRLTVLLRWLLLVPQFIVLFFLGIAAFFVVIVGWFAALFTGRLPEGVARFLAGFLAYDTRVMADAMLLVDRYPPFALYPVDPYPTRIELRPGTLNRLAVLFRIFLMIPAGIIRYLLEWGWYTLAVFIWLIVLVLGRMPRPVFEATAAVLRYGMRFEAYALMLTSAYPKRLFGDPPDEVLATPGTTPGTTAAPGSRPEGGTGATGDRASVAGGGAGAGIGGGFGTGGQGWPFPASATRPLVLSGTAQVLVVAFLVIGLAGSILSDSTNWEDDHHHSSAPGTPAHHVGHVNGIGRVTGGTGGTG